jgi:hypothetical protein
MGSITPPGTVSQSSQPPILFGILMGQVSRLRIPIFDRSCKRLAHSWRVPATLKGCNTNALPRIIPFWASFSCSLLSRADWPGALARPSHAINLADINMKTFCKGRVPPLRHIFGEALLRATYFFLTASHRQFPIRFLRPAGWDSACY